MRTVNALFTTNDRLYREVNGIKQSMLVKLNPAYVDEDSINRSFWEATPTGTLEMQINNPAVFDLFVPGKSVHITFTFTDA